MGGGGKLAVLLFRSDANLVDHMGAIACDLPLPALGVLFEDNSATQAAAADVVGYRLAAEPHLPAIDHRFRLDHALLIGAFRSEALNMKTSRSESWR